MTQRRTYRRNAARITSVTVLPSSRAFSAAACHTSSGTRTVRIGVSATDAPRSEVAAVVVGPVDGGAVLCHAVAGVATGGVGGGELRGPEVGAEDGRQVLCGHGAIMHRCIYGVKGCAV